MLQQGTRFFRVFAFFVFAAAACGSAPAKDPMMTSHVQVRPDGVAAVEFESQMLEAKALGKTPPAQCELNPDSILDLCRNVQFDSSSQGNFKDISALPLASGATSVKVGVARYNLHLGRDFTIPFSLLSSNVAGTGNPSKINSLKLLDPDQGNLNLKWTYAGKYKVGPLCNFAAGDAGKCLIGFNFGYRYMALEKSTGGTSTGSQGAYGAYLSLTNSFVFPVTRAAARGVAGKADDTDQLVVNLAVSRSQQNSGAVVLFPDARDANGNPLTLGKTYTSFAATAKLHITDKIGIEAARYKAGSSSSLVGNVTTIAVSLEVQ